MATSSPDYPKADPRYAGLTDAERPQSESLKDVLARVLPYWQGTIVPDLKAGKRVLIVAHGNSLRALMKHLEGISDAQIAEVNLPTGIPRAYRLDAGYNKSVEARYLGDAAEIAAKAKAVADRQAKRQLEGRMKRYLIPAVLLVTCTAAVAAAAPPRPAAPDSIAARYEHARQVLEQSRAQEAATQAERDRLAAEAHALAERLVANAARVQTLEAEVAQSEKDLARLSGEALALQVELARGRDKVARLLAVLQRVDNDEPPALALRPDDSLAAARGAMLVGSLLQPVYGAAHTLSVKLHKLGETRTAIERKRLEARVEEAALKRARANARGPSETAHPRSGARQSQARRIAQRDPGHRAPHHRSEILDRPHRRGARRGERRHRHGGGHSRERG